MLFEPGAPFGRYRLVRQLGRGGFAEVWLARQAGKQGFERRVALKVLNAYRTDDDRSLETLVNEARVGGALEHPNIVQVFAIDEVDGTWFVAMEFVEGPDLGSLLRALSGAGLRMPASIVLGIGLQIARALEYAHAATDIGGRPLNLVHRDLKPPNVLVSRKGAVKVTDFGIAKAATNINSTSTGTVKGTPLYMAPELWAGEREFHPRIDLFALGAMLVELATGQRLLQGDTAAAIAGQAIFGDADEEAARLDDVLPELAPVVRGLLQRKPAERTQDAAEVVGELQRLSREVPAPGDLSLFVQLVDVLDLPVPERSQALSTLRIPIATDAAWSRLVTAARGDRVEPDPILVRPVPSLLVEQIVRGGPTTTAAARTVAHQDATPMDSRIETATAAAPGATGPGVETGAVTATSGTSTGPGVDTAALTAAVDRPQAGVDTGAITRAEGDGPVRLGPGILQPAPQLRGDAPPPATGSSALITETRIEPRRPPGTTRIVRRPAPRPRRYWPWVVGGLLVAAVVVVALLRDWQPMDSGPTPTEPAVTAEPTAAPTPAPVATATALSTATPVPTAAPTARPTAAPTVRPTATPTPTPPPTPTEPPTPTPTPAVAQATRGCITFGSEPAGAEIQVNGKTAAFVARRRSPPLRSYEPGGVRVVMGRGDQAVSATVQVRAGVRHRVQCELGEACTVTEDGTCP